MKKELAFLTRTFLRKGTRLVRASGAFEAGEALAFGGAWGALEGRVDRTRGRFEVHERAEDGATLLLSGSLDDAASLEPLRWDDFAYDLHVAPVTAAAASTPAPSKGITRSSFGDCFTHTFRPERGRMLCFALRGSDGALVGLLFGDERSLAPLAPPPVGCPVLRALVGRHGETFGPRTALTEPVVVEALRASHRDDKKAAKVVAETHTERALAFNRARLAALLERLPGYENDAAAVRAIEPRPTSTSWGEAVWFIHARLMDAELAARPEAEPEALSKRAQVAGRAFIGVTVWAAETKGVRWWGPATDLAKICQQSAETAARVGLWNVWPDPNATDLWLASLAAPSLAVYLAALRGD